MKWLGLLFLLLVTNLAALGYGMYSVSAQKFPFHQVVAMKRWVNPQRSEADWISPSDIHQHFYKDADVVMFGDSLTLSANWSEIFPDLNIVNRGISGDTTLGVLTRIDDVLLTTPSRIFLLVGINDVYRGDKAERILERYARILDRLDGKAQVYVQSPLYCSGPKCSAARATEIRRLNEGLQRLAAARNMIWIDLNAGLSGPDGLRPEFTWDGIHLNAAGLAVWLKAIEPYLI